MKTVSLNSKNFIAALFSALSIITLFAITSCNNSGSPEAEIHQENEHHATHTEVTITKKQFDAIKIQLGRIEQKNLVDGISVTGFLKVPPQNKANVTVPGGGTVSAILVLEGDYVRKGQALATLVNPDLVKMQQEFLDVKSQIGFAEAEYKRQKELSQNNVSAQKTFQQAESNYQSLKAKQSGLVHQLNILGINADNLSAENIASVISVRSPINGNISHIAVNIGSHLDPSQELMDVVDNSQLHMDLFVYEQDFPKIKVGQMVDVTLINIPGKQYTAKVFAIGSAFEGESKAIPVHASITGEKEGLIEGMNVVANIHISNNLTAAVPTEAIISSGGNDYLLIQIEGHEEVAHEHSEAEEKMVKEELGELFTFESIPVKKGVTNGSFTEVTPLKDISENARVVINGAFYLMSMLTNTGEEAHEH